MIWSPGDRTSQPIMSLGHIWGGFHCRGSLRAWNPQPGSERPNLKKNYLELTPSPKEEEEKKGRRRKGGGKKACCCVKKHWGFQSLKRNVCVQIHFFRAVCDLVSSWVAGIWWLQVKIVAHWHWLWQLAVLIFSFFSSDKHTSVPLRTEGCLHWQWVEILKFLSERSQNPNLDEKSFVCIFNLAAWALESSDTACTAPCVGETDTNTKYCGGDR